MPPFDVDADLTDDQAYHLIKNSAVSLYWRPALFEGTLDWLADHGYQLVLLDALRWRTEGDFHDAIASALEFPGHYGRNLDAFADCMRDVGAYRYGAIREATGTILALRHYDSFAVCAPYPGQAILDIFATEARAAMLFGHRMLCLLQSDDPRVYFEDVGSTPVAWNPYEWLESSRR